MLIGLNGKKQAGKDTVYERILHLYGPGTEADQAVERVSFADKLYESAAAALGVDVEFLRRWKSDPGAGMTLVVPSGDPTPYGDTVVRAGCLTFREFLQNYGTEAHREVFGQDFWTNAVDLSHDGRIVVVTDVRFPNEAEAVFNAGGRVVKVVGPEEVEAAGDGHASEAPLPYHQVDTVLFNRHRDDEFRTLDYNVVRLLAALFRLEREYGTIARPGL